MYDYRLEFDRLIPYWQSGAEIVLGMAPSRAEAWITELRAECDAAPVVFMNEGAAFQVAHYLAKQTRLGPTVEVWDELTRAIIDSHNDASDHRIGWERARMLLEPLMQKFGGQLPDPHRRK